MEDLVARAKKHAEEAERHAEYQRLIREASDREPMGGAEKAFKLRDEEDRKYERIVREEHKRNKEANVYARHAGKGHTPGRGRFT